MAKIKIEGSIKMPKGLTKKEFEAKKKKALKDGKKSK